MSGELRELLLEQRVTVGARRSCASIGISVISVTDDPAVLVDVDVPAIWRRRVGHETVDVKVLIKGAGEQASATAHRLFRCGFASS